MSSTFRSLHRKLFRGYRHEFGAPAGHLSQAFKGKPLLPESTSFRLTSSRTFRSRLLGLRQHVLGASLSGITLKKKGSGRFGGIGAFEGRGRGPWRRKLGSGTETMHEKTFRLGVVLAVPGALVLVLGLVPVFVLSALLSAPGLFVCWLGMRPALRRKIDNE